MKSLALELVMMVTRQRTLLKEVCSSTIIKKKRSTSNNPENSKVYLVCITSPSQRGANSAEHTKTAIYYNKAGISFYNIIYILSLKSM